jgi:copper chaperone CopZ
LKLVSYNRLRVVSHVVLSSKMVDITVKTKGMTCSACEMLVQDALEELDGVTKVKALHESNIIHVSFDINKVSKDEIIKIIINEGYSVED